MAHTVGTAGTLTTYDMTVGLKLDIEDLFHLLDPYDVPLYGSVGADGQTALARGNAIAKKVEWLDEELLTPRSVLTAAATDAADTIEVENALKFGIGDVIALGDEKVLVTGVDYGDDELTVSRGYGGTDEAAHDEGADVVGVGLALPEGSDPEEARALDRANVHNYTQIFGPTQVKVSGTENVVAKYGLQGTTEFQHQVSNRVKESGVAIEQALLYGTRFEDTANNRRTMGGLSHFIQTLVDDETETLTEEALLDQAQAVYDNGGTVTRAVCGSKQKRVISGFKENIQVQVGRSERTRGQVVTFFESDFGLITVILDRWARESDLFLFSRDQAEIATLRPLVFEALAKTGDSIKGQIVCEKTLRFRRERHSARFSALT